MRILLLNDSAEKAGGAETYFYNLKDLLKEKGHKVQTYFSTNTVKFNLLGSIFSIKNLIKSYKKIKSFDPDIAHLHKYNLSLSVSPLIAAKLLKKKTIITFHDFGLLCCNGWCVDEKGKPCNKPTSIKWVFRKSLSNKGLIKKLYDYIKNSIHIFMMKRFVDVCIGPSKAITNYLKELFGGLSPQKSIVHIPYFIKFHLEIKKKGNKVIYVGRLTKEKGVDWLISAFKNVVKEFDSAKLLIIGGGQEKKNLQLLSKQLNLTKNIEFKGIMEHKQIIKVYKETRVIVIPSIWMENNPLVLYEALASGVPAIGTDMGGIPDLIKDRYNGYIVGRFNMDFLSDRIIRLLKDERLAIRMGNNGKRLIEKEFNPERHIKDLMLQYKTEENFNNK